MPPLTLNDQANAERLAQRAAGEFVYCPAYATWERRVGPDGWEPGETAFRERYVELMSEIDGETTRAEIYGRNAALLKTSQQAVMWILERDSRFVVEPSEVSRPIYSEDDWQPDEQLCALFRAYGPESALRNFLADSMRTRTHGVVGPRIFVRTVRQAADPGDLYPLLMDRMPDRIARLPLHLWRTWPERLTPEWARRLWGLSLVFLDAPEPKCRSPFPEEALWRLLRPEQEWQGHDRRFYTMPMPRAYVLGGPPHNTQNWEPALAALALEARPFMTMG